MADENREPGSVIRIDENTELRTACGHSFVTCHTNRCFRRTPGDPERRGVIRPDPVAAVAVLLAEANLAYRRRPRYLSHSLDDARRNLCRQLGISSYVMSPDAISPALIEQKLRAALAGTAP